MNNENPLGQIYISYTTGQDLTIVEHRFMLEHMFDTYSNIRSYGSPDKATYTMMNPITGVRYSISFANILTMIYDPNPDLESNDIKQLMGLEE